MTFALRDGEKNSSRLSIKHWPLNTASFLFFLAINRDIKAPSLEEREMPQTQLLHILENDDGPSTEADNKYRVWIIDGPFRSATTGHKGTEKQL